MWPAIFALATKAIDLVILLLPKRTGATEEPKDDAAARQGTAAGAAANEASKRVR